MFNDNITNNAKFHTFQKNSSFAKRKNRQSQPILFDSRKEISVFLFQV
jgi:hypothetical protein